MTYSLPFGLKQKPMTHYFEHGVIKFNIREGQLFFQVKHIQKYGNYSIFDSRLVQSKEHLDKLLAVKSWSEIPSLEEVVQ